MYSLEQLSLISGLTTRTLRNDLKSGVLCGEKQGGVWQFSEEQAEAFLEHPAVRPGIRAKQNGILYDFQSGYDCTDNESCVLLNLSLSRKDAQAAAAFFCAEAGKSSHIRFSYRYERKTARFILKGAEAEVSAIMKKYYRRTPER